MKRLTYRTPYGIEYHDKVYRWDIKSKLADYEDAEEQGLLIKLPCKMGNKVYCCDLEYDTAKDIEECACHGFMIGRNKELLLLCNGAWVALNQGAFLSRAEAEKALSHD